MDGLSQEKPVRIILHGIYRLDSYMKHDSFTFPKFCVLVGFDLDESDMSII